jgi:hypothetical protein
VLFSKQQNLIEIDLKGFPPTPPPTYSEEQLTNVQLTNVASNSTLEIETAPPTEEAPVIRRSKKHVLVTERDSPEITGRFSGIIISKSSSPRICFY